MDEKSRKICIVSFDNDIENSHLLSLTDEQINLLNWLKEQGFDITVNIQNDVEVI